jgi:heme exporter protein D
MQWNSAADFFAMGGYGLYVWLSYGACLAVVVLEPWLVKQRRARAIMDNRRKAMADQFDNEAP